MVGYALAAQYPARITRWVVIDAPLPGIGHWAGQLSNPKTWHFNFHGPDEERLVAGRERIYLDRFYNELSAHPERIDEQTRAHYATLYARPHAMHDAFEQFVAFPQDGVDNRAFLAKGKLTMPVLALGGEKSYGLTHEGGSAIRRRQCEGRRRARTPATGSWKKILRPPPSWCWTPLQVKPVDIADAATRRSVLTAGLPRSGAASAPP